jgi:hypothetical protein
VTSARAARHVRKPYHTAGSASATSTISSGT